MMNRMIIILSWIFVQSIFTEAQDHQRGKRILNDSLINKHFLLGVDLFNKHDDTGEALEEARQEFLKVLKTNPSHASSVAYLGLISLDEKRLDSADSSFTQALLIDSTCPEARIGRSQLFRNKSQWQKGYEEIRTAVRLSPQSSFARWEFVHQLIHRAEAPVTEIEYKEAIPHLKKLLELNSDDRDAHQDLAVSYEQLKQWQDAVQHYREVLRIGQIPEDMDVWVYTVHLDVSRCLENLHRYSDTANELMIYLNYLKEYQADEETIKNIERKVIELQSKKE